MYFPFKMSLLFLFCSLLNRNQVFMTTITCTFENNTKEAKVIDLSTVEKRRIPDYCFCAKTISLQGETTFAIGDLNEGDLNCILAIDKIEMCVLVENASATFIISNTRSFSGSCKGPKLSVVNNPYLKNVFLHPELLGMLNSTPKSIRIRGNRMMLEENLKLLETKFGKILDLQGIGECPLPRPFTSFDELDRNCTSFYGSLVLKQGESNISYNSSELHKFGVEGCIQIEKTELRDITFLNAFLKFKPIPYCTQYIRDNKNLCFSNLNYLNEYFIDVNFYNNSDQLCDECLGGRVSQYFLSESKNCSIVVGDLIISNFRGLPPNMDNLRGIVTIKGRLIITNNTGLNKFEHLVSLKEIEFPNESTSVIVKDNADLEVLAIPKLLNYRIEEEDKRIELLNNPMLNVKEMRTTTEQTKAAQATTIFENNITVKSTWTSSSSNKSARINAWSEAIFGAVALTLVCSLRNTGNFVFL